MNISNSFCNRQFLNADRPTARKTTFKAKAPYSFVSRNVRFANGIHELKKNMLFYKIFPFLNRKPRTIIVGDTTLLRNEFRAPYHLRKQVTEGLAARYHKLRNKTKG